MHPQDIEVASRPDPAAPDPAAPDPWTGPAAPFARPTRRAGAADAPALAGARAYQGGFARLQADRYRLPAAFATGPDAATRRAFARTQWLLGGGRADPGASMRAWYRRFEWAHYVRAWGPGRAAAWVAREPARVVAEARGRVARHGAFFRAHHGVPEATQLRDLIALRLRHGIDAETYYQNALWRPERRADAGAYFQDRVQRIVARVLARREAPDDFLLLEDKRRTERWCRAHGLPTVTTLVAFEDGRPTAWADAASPHAALAEAAGADLFSKPVDLSGGAGACRWRWRAGAWENGRGARYDAAGLLAAVAYEARGDARLLQRCVPNHPALAGVTSEALSTARLVTVRPPGGAPELTAAAFRTGLGASATDNLHTGGLAVAIDLATGRLGRGIRVLDQWATVEVARHPDTDAPFAGVQLPAWAAARALVLRAHALLPAIALVGWDVAFTPEGLLLVEANVNPEVRLSQAPSGHPLGRTNHVRFLDAQLRHSYARRDGRG